MVLKLVQMNQCIKCVKKNQTTYVSSSFSNIITLNDLHKLKNHMDLNSTDLNVNGIVLGNSDDLKLHKMYA